MQPFSSWIPLLIPPFTVFAVLVKKKESKQ
jgi:hypothetical protein